MKNRPIYITGHQHPDTDSIVSSIAYAYLKQQLGINAVPARLGDLNVETKYLLNRFKFDEPVLLHDAKTRLYDIDLIPPIAVNADDTLFEALRKMLQYDQPYMAVLENNKVVGMITRNDIALIGLGDTAVGINLLKETSLENFCKTLNGRIIYEDPQMHLNGKVSIIALSVAQASNYDVKDRIVIVGDDPWAQIQLIRKGAGLLVAVWTDTIDESVISQAKEYHCPIIISGHGSMNTSRYLYFAPTVSLLMTNNLMTFYSYEFMGDVAKKMMKNRFRAYPVITKEKELLGYILKNHAMDYKNKQIIMVDHNEFSQSVPSIEKGEVLEVVDHHRIYDFYSTKPIAFRNEIVGSTATIITSMFIEKEVEIPKDLAGLLLGAILSDTLNFQSPTCTQKDLDMAARLESICEINSEELAYDMFFVSSDISEKSVSDFLNEDVKHFNIDEYTIMIAQVIVSSTDVLDTMQDSIQEELDKYMHRNQCDLGVLVFTSIIENGSIFYVSGKLSNWFKEVYPDKEDGKPDFLAGVLSRKNQVVPMITEIIERNS